MEVSLCHCMVLCLAFMAVQPIRKLPRIHVSSAIICYIMSQEHVGFLETGKELPDCIRKGVKLYVI